MIHPVSKLFLFTLLTWTVLRSQGAPVIDPVAPVSVPAGKSLIIPITASSPTGRPLTYTVTSSTNRITVEVHTNNPFWRMSIVQIAPPDSPGVYPTTFRGASVLVTNVGDMTFMLFKDRAPRTVKAFTGFSHAGFYNSNTIFHRVVPGFLIQGGDPATNGTGGPVFQFDDEFHPRAIFSGNGQLAMANSGKDSNGSQFFVTFGTPRRLDFNHTIFGQLLRGFEVQTNVVNTPRNAGDRPLREVIIQRASIVTNTTDTVITLTATNLPGVSGTIRVIADDGAGGRATNTFTATAVADTNNAPPFLYPNTVTNLTAPINTRLTNHIAATDLEAPSYYWFPYYADLDSFLAASNSIFTTVNDQLQFILVPATNYAGSIAMNIFVSSDPNWYLYFENLPSSFWPTHDTQTYRFAVGETAIRTTGTNFAALPAVAFTNQLLATFTNGLPTSPSDNFTASINWGDNAITSGLIQSNASGHKEVRGTHTFTNAGHYPVEITIRSTLGAQAVAISTAIVPPALSFTRWGNTNLLQWPSWAAGYQLQSHTNPATPDWLTLTNHPAFSSYDNFLIHTNTANHEFFRLKK